MERISRRRLDPRGAVFGSAWQHIVKGPGLALEVLSAWVESERIWRIVAAGRHELLCFVMPGEEASDDNCALVGGPCEYVSLVLPVLGAWEKYCQASDPSTDRPEMYWEELERIAFGRRACP